MGETIEMINKHSKVTLFWFQMLGNTKCLPAGAKFNSTKSNVTSGLGTMGFALLQR
jgi:hypothetical protein